MDIETNNHKDEKTDEETDEEDTYIDAKDNNDIIIKEMRENISKNSLHIADLLNSKDNDKNIKSNHSDDSNPLTPRRVRYIYANVFDDSLDDSLDDSNEWSDIKRYRFQKCLWKLKYNRVVCSF